MSLAQTYPLNAAGIAQAVEDAIPQLACTLRPDVLEAFKRSLAQADPQSREAMVLGQLLENAAIAASNQVPLCQDTGTARVLLELGQELALPGNIFSQVDEAVARAYEAAHLRMSTLEDALFSRENPGNNTPAFCDVLLVPGTTARLHIMLKGGGSDNASKVFMLAPGEGLEGVERVVLETVRAKAASACPPLLIGVGVGSTFDEVAKLAKHALLRPVGSAAQSPEAATFEQQLLTKVNKLGIGAGALGGLTTAVGVHLATAPCHIAALPVAVNLGCSAMRSLSVDLEVQA